MIQGHVHRRRTQVRDAPGSLQARFFSGVVNQCRIRETLLEWLTKPNETSVTLPLTEYAESCGKNNNLRSMDVYGDLPTNC
ncbi:hypothetical protein PEC301619_18760 [Pectobacterium carotovorum subsp. carotovorum]|nr:hypothetical protein PEC301619_18760 [Pectobacterium carotovorum subsp. carotovorum]